MSKVLGGRLSLLDGFFVGGVAALLAGLLFPTVGCGESAARADAKTLLGSIAAAVRQYRTEYGKYPDAGFGGLVADDAASAKLFCILRGLDADANPKKIVFFEAKIRSSRKSAPGTGFDPKSGALLDSWGHVYRIVMDADGDGRIASPYSDLDEIRMGVIAWSLGDDGQQGVPGRLPSTKPPTISFRGGE